MSKVFAHFGLDLTSFQYILSMISAFFCLVFGLQPMHLYNTWQCWPVSSYVFLSMWVLLHLTDMTVPCLEVLSMLPSASYTCCFFTNFHFSFVWCAVVRPVIWGNYWNMIGYVQAQMLPPNWLDFSAFCVFSLRIFIFSFWGLQCANGPCLATKRGTNERFWF